jgi:hypothetical protein
LNNKRKKYSAKHSKNKRSKTNKTPETKTVTKRIKSDVWFKDTEALSVNLLTKYDFRRNSTFERKLCSQSAKSDAKITKHVITYKGIFLKPGCSLYKNENNQFCVGMKCVICKKMHPRNVLFFNRDVKLEQFESAQLAHGRLCNSVSDPCRLCGCPKSQIQFLKRWQPLYPNITIPQMIDIMSNQKGIGRISGFPIEFQTGKISFCCYKILPGKTRYESQTYENSFYDVELFNPKKFKYLERVEDYYDEMSQLEIDLKKPNVEIFKTMHLTLKESGVTANCTTDTKLYRQQVDYFHLPRIIQGMVTNLIDLDIRTGRISENNLAKTDPETRKNIQHKVIDYIISINGKCELIGYDLTVVNGPFRFALDRIDKSKVHFMGEDCLDISNIRVICRLFNTNPVQTIAQHQACLNYRRSLPRDANGKAIYD